MDELLKTLHELCDIYAEAIKDAKIRLKKSGPSISVGDADYMDRLTHTIKSIKTTIAMMEAEDEGGYSGRYNMPYYPNVGMSYEGRGGSSYADGRMSDGRGASYASRGRTNARRDSMGRYSSNGYSYAEDELHDIVTDIRGMMDELPAEKRRTVERLVNELEH